MASASWPSSGAASPYWKEPVATYASLPASGSTLGEVRLVRDTGQFYRFNGTSWDATPLTITGLLAIANGGTNSGAALLNDLVLISEAGAIVESTISTTELGYLGGVTSGIQGQFAAVTGDVATNAADIATNAGDIATNTGNIATNATNIATLTSTKISTSLATGNILIGVAGTAAAVAPTGDVTIDTAGVTAIGASKVTNSMLAGSIAYSKLVLTGAVVAGDLAGSIPYSKLVLTGAVTSGDLAGSIAFSKLAILSPGNLIVGDFSNVPTSRAITGDVTLDYLGVTAIGAGVVTNAMLAGSIAGSKVLPDFVAQNIKTTGNGTIGAAAALNTFMIKTLAVYGGSAGTAGIEVAGQSSGTSSSSGAVLFADPNNTETHKRQAAIIGKSASGSATVGGQLSFFTTNTSAALTERLRINEAGAFDFQAGNLTTTGDIWTTGKIGAGAATPLFALDIDKTVSGNNYVAHFRNKSAALPYTVWIEEPGSATTGYPLLDISNSGGSALYLRVSSGGAVRMSSLAGSGSRAVNADVNGVITAASDSRLKQEVVGARIPGLAEVLQLSPVAYKWLHDIETRGEDAAVEVGFFADQVAPIIPSAAPMGNDGYYGFYDRSVVAALVKAVQELEARLALLEGSSKVV